MFKDTFILTEWLKESSRHFKKTKEFSKKVREYYNGDQLDRTIKQILANRGQPEQYENNIAKHNNAILGFKKERQIDIRLFGRQQRDRVGAEMLNALLKAITQVSDYEVEIDALDDELSLEGVAIAELTINASGEFDEFGREHKDIEIKQVPSNECYLDPFSRAKNYNHDARYIHRCFWIDTEDLLGLGFDEKKINEVTNINYVADIVEDDMWADETIRKRVLLSYTWYRKYDEATKKDKFYYCFWSDVTILLQGESPYDFDGFPYEVEFLSRDFLGKIKYWGLYRDIMPIQDHINYAKLRLQNMMANNKTLINRGALIDGDMEAFNSEYSLDNATVMVEDINGVKDIKQNVQIQQILGIIIDGRQQISELLNSNKEMLGTANNRMSAVGQEQRVQTGLVGLSRFMNSSDNLQKKIIKKSVKFIEQYYDTQRVVSIVDEDYIQDYITMNEAILNDNGGVELEVLADGKVKPIVSNAISVGKYDLIFTAKPKSNSMSSERLRQNVELLKVLQSTDPELVKYLIPDILKDSDSPSAKKIREIIEQRDTQSQNSPQAQQNAQLQAENEKLNMMVKQSQANLNNTKAKAMLDRNQIDLQKAFSNSLVQKETVKAKHDKNQLDAMRRIG
ncbi:MAG: hypothetical protein RQ763_00075 [Sulfurimonas sp.]|uniref:portal protein n=1 Tax=Sulfurimonas sp. TaxID=2022749 RepID=UPI0028CEB4FD|nr:hypothetical protein [Sulfurimonas sp.]MDT8337569.1 hypothetical protein [Sulfurimonas sp.]